MSNADKTDYNKLNQLADTDIDYTDIQETNAAFWRDAEVIYPSKKTHLSIRLDDDIIAWFKQFGRGYQSKINAVLRSYISNARKTQSKDPSRV